MLQPRHRIQAVQRMSSAGIGGTRLDEPRRVRNGLRVLAQGSSSQLVVAGLDTKLNKRAHSFRKGPR